METRLPKSRIWKAFVNGVCACLKLKILNLGADLFWLNKFELHSTSCPGNKVTIGRIIQQRNQKLPKLEGATTLVWWAVPINGGLLLYLPCQGQEWWGLEFATVAWASRREIPKHMLLMWTQCSFRTAILQGGEHLKTTEMAWPLTWSLSIKTIDNPWWNLEYLQVSREPRRCRRNTTVDLGQMRSLQTEGGNKDTVRFKKRIRWF